MGARPQSFFFCLSEFIRDGQRSRGRDRWRVYLPHRACRICRIDKRGEPCNGAFVFQSTCIAAVLIIPRVFIQFAWQASNEFKRNAFIIILERAFFLVSVLFYLFKRFTNVHELIYLDVAGKALALIIAIVLARDLVFHQPLNLRSGLSELKSNVVAGGSLMLASISSSLIIGLIQLSIKSEWGIDTYSRIALTFSLSNLLMIFINALALVLLPHIKRQENDDNLRLHKNMRHGLIFFLFILLNVYYPFRLFVNFWLPKYAEGIVYMAILFPICIYESKTQLLTNTYLKAYRKERDILKANLISLGLCLLLMLLFAKALRNLFLTTLAIVIVLAFRSVLSEYFLSRETGQSYRQENLIELAVTAVFVLTQWFIGGWQGAVLYLGITILFAYRNREIFHAIADKFKKRRFAAK